jgi:putative transposase
MKYHPDKHHRRSIRLNGYDYSQNGAYFVTICTNNHEKIFGNVNNGKMELNEYGKIVDQYWIEIPKHYPNVILDEYIIMPYHIHGIIVINGKDNHNFLRFASQSFSNLFILCRYFEI